MLVAAGSFAQTPPPAWLEAGWIAREPRIAPPNRPDAPPEEGWPEAGSQVHWVAHVLNRGRETAAAVPYSWRIDGDTVAAGDIDLPPGETTVWLPWSWSVERHEVSFALDPPASLQDATADDDRVTIASDALSLGFWVEQGVYDWMAEGGRPGFERWAQGEIELWNQILARAVHPTTPHGVLDRLRLDQIIIEADDVKSRMKDLDTDLGWWVHTSPYDPRFLHKGIRRRDLADQTIILHELLHQRGITDLYAYEVHHGGPTQSRMEIHENGRLVAGSTLMPFLPLRPSVVYRLPDNGIMGNLYRHGANLTEHSAFGLNLRAGRRTPLWFDQWGNVINGFSSQYQHDSYLDRRPDRVELRLRDQEDRPLAQAELSVFLDRSTLTYRDLYAAEPSSDHRTDASGVAWLSGAQLVPARPEQVIPDSRTIILRVTSAAARGYAFLPVYDLNLLAFRGGEEEAALDLRIEMHPWSTAIE